MAIILSASEAERRAAAVAADKARAEYFTNTNPAGKAWAPTTYARGTPEPGGTPLLERYEQQWAQELLEATPSVISGHTVEHYEAVRRDVDRRRAEILAQANAIASRSRTP
jgi:hypothetical protein